MHRIRWPVILLLLAMLAPAIAPGAPDRVAASHTTIKLPFLGTGPWYAWEGYNYSPIHDGTHWDCDPNTGYDVPSQSIPCRPLYIYKYSFDLRRVDGKTALQPVLAPADGTICWIDNLGFGGGAIDLGDGYVFAYFHTRIAGGLAPGQFVRRGQFLGVVAPPGEAGNGGIAHLHINLWRSSDCGGGDRTTEPFTGNHRLNGYNFPALADSVQNQHVDKRMTSTNAVAGTVKPSTPALSAPANGAMLATATPLLTWGVSTRAIEYQVVIDGGAVRSPWLEGRRWRPPDLAPGQHTWQVRGRNPLATGSLSGARRFTVPRGVARLQISPAAGRVASPIAVNGRGFRAGETVDLTWDEPGGLRLRAVTADASGTFATSVRVPKTIGGGHTMLATGRSSGRQASAPFAINRAVVIAEPVAGNVADTVAIRGYGFGRDEPVFVAWDGFITDFGDSSADENGSFRVTTIVPPLPAGPHTIELIGEVSDQRGTDTFTVEPSLTTSPSSGPARTAITARGSGWPARAPVALTWTPASGGGSDPVCRATVSSTGSFVCRFRAPAGTPGVTYRIVATSGAYSEQRSFRLTGAAAAEADATATRPPSTAVPTPPAAETPVATETAISTPTLTAPDPTPTSTEISTPEPTSTSEPSPPELTPPATGDSG